MREKKWKIYNYRRLKTRSIKKKKRHQARVTSKKLKKLARSATEYTENSKNPGQGTQMLKLKTSETEEGFRAMRLRSSLPYT